jgi:virginiamycin A acetyltransferase
VPFGRAAPPFAAVAGNPARAVRARFDPMTAATLLRTAWWNWPAEKIVRNVAAIMGADIAALENAA